MAKTRLRKLKITEGSLVTRGANQHADVLFFKADEGDEVERAVVKVAEGVEVEVARVMGDTGPFRPVEKGPGADAVEAVHEAEMARQHLWMWMDHFYVQNEVLQKAMRMILEDPAVEDKTAAIGEAVEATMMMIKAGPEMLKKLDEAGYDTFAGFGEVVKGLGAPPKPSDTGAGGDGNSGSESMDKVAQLEGQIADLQKRLDEAEAARKALEDEKTAVAKAEGERVAKAEAEAAELKKAVETVTAQAEALQKSHDALLEKAEVDAACAEAEKRWPFTKGTREEKGTQLRALKKMGEAGEAILKSLDAADKMTSTLMSSVGKSGAIQDEASATAELNQRSVELRKADPSLTPAAAMKKVFETDPELQRRYDLEVRGRV